MPFDGDDIEEGVFIFNPVDELLCIGDDGFDDTFTWFDMLLLLGE